MKINSVSLSLPSWKVSNDEVIDIIKYHSKPVFYGNLDKTLRKASVILKKTGAENRFWLNRSKKERPIDHLKEAVDDALSRANLKKSDIDILIYVGIGRGFLEPGNSYFVANSLGMKKVRCFDIIDACMSWMTALQVIDGFFRSGKYKKAMIVNAEFIVHGGVLFKNYALHHESQLEYSFPTFTIGEGASCTIVSPGDDLGNFEFNFFSRPDLVNLCQIPLYGFQDYCDINPDFKFNGAMRFTSFGGEMHEKGSVELAALYKESSIDKDSLDIVFTHASSKSEWQKCADSVGLGNKVYHIYQDTGNLISASVPGAMSIALKNKKLKRGDNVLAWVGSAGMSFSTMKFEF